MTKYTNKLQKNKFDLSVVLVSYNTKKLTDDCIASLNKSDLNLQTIVVDNNSSDGSIEMIEKKYPNIILIKNTKNLGFSKGNNKARKFIKSDYVLFLNTDTIVYKNSIKTPLQYIKEHPEIGAITCKVVLKDGSLDLDTRRTYPTPMTALKHFMGDSNEYRYLNRSEDEVHDVDVIQGAFFLTRRELLDKIGWFDEDYFLDGEDIDLSYRVKEAGYRLIYYPKSKITHIKKASKKTDQKKSLKSVLRGVEAMELFYKKHLTQKYPFFVNWLVLGGINVLKLLRIIKFYLS